MRAVPPVTRIISAQHRTPSEYPEELHLLYESANTGEKIIAMSRSTYDPSTGTDKANPRQQTNGITAFIDASNVYGSDNARAEALRRSDETGRLKTSHNGLFLPFNTDGFPNAGGSDPELFLAGDIRANEQVGLTAMHTLFVREHNRLAKELRRKRPNLSGEDIYQKVRAWVGAEMQVITYQEFLPVLLGKDALSTYKGYDPESNPGISNVFSTAAYRLGHSMLSSQILRLDAKGNPIDEGNLPLREAFFSPITLTNEGGIAPILRGLANQVMQEVDTLVVSDVRNFLFGPPPAPGLDLASLNIQRGRDHGLPSYNATRVALGLNPANTFGDVSSDEDVQDRLARVYGNVEDIDLWVGGLAEDHVPGALVGEVFYTLLKDQFERLRDGDRLWYQNIYHGKKLWKLKHTTLSDIIHRNTTINRREINKNVH